jgi:hypothetical protein
MNNVVIAARPLRGFARWFYVWMAGLCSLIAFGGFAPTYWLQLLPGTFIGSPLLHLHAVLFSAWTLYFVIQATIAARGQIGRHRTWGLLGISLATAMVFVGVSAANDVLAWRLAAGLGDPARAFHIVPISLMFLFGVLVCAAIATVTRPEIHRRLMLLATISVMPPAIARIFYAFNAGVAPGARPGLGPLRTVESVSASGFMADALILAGIANDVRTRGRPHLAYVIGGILIIAVQVLRGPVSTTQWWYAIADFLARFSV